MAYTEVGHEGSLNGTNSVTVVAAPASGVRRVIRTITVHNGDTAPVTVTVRKTKAATSYAFITEELAAGEYLTFDLVQVLDATDESITAVLAAAVATTNPTFTAASMDAA